jgi:DNA polymerase elongation subunit (family B)
MKYRAPPTPRILIWDLENSPSLGFFYGKEYETNILQTIRQWHLMSFAAKWLDSKDIIVKALPDYPLYKRDKFDDRALVQDLHKLLSQADVLVAHNGDAFDTKKANARFIIHGLDPIPPLKSVDTLKIARRNFSFNSNRLDDLGNYLGIGRKLVHTGKHLWLACLDGNLDAWKTMRKYNVQDVLLLERLYKKVRPWHATHPNLNALSRQPIACPKCGSTNLWKRGYNYTLTSEAQRFQCRECFGWCMGKPEKLALKVQVR